MDRMEYDANKRKGVNCVRVTEIRRNGTQRVNVFLDIGNLRKFFLT